MSTKQGPVVAVAGGTGDVGGRIVRALAARGARVRALVRPDATAEQRGPLAALGEIAAADPDDVKEMAGALAGADCVVSALNGVRAAIIGRQGVLLDAAVAAGVPRFIPSDYAADFTRTGPGRNRNFDLRREFMARVDAAPITATSILNGAFMDMLGREMPIIRPRLRRIVYWGDADQPLDFTTRDDTAAFVAAAAMDAGTPRILRIAGDVTSARGIAATMSEVTGRRFGLLRAGGIGALGMMIRIARMVSPSRDAPFPAWQGMQYMRDMFSGEVKLVTLDNDRYPGLGWTSIAAMMRARVARGEPAA